MRKQSLVINLTRYFFKCRPISVRIFLTKSWEKQYAVKWKKNHTNNFFYRDQHNFLNSESMTDFILELTKEWNSALSREERLISVFLKFCEAIDTVSHEFLNKKKHWVDKSWKSSVCFGEIFSNRMHYLQVNGLKSAKFTHTFDVPQGSTRAPRFFVLCINDYEFCSRDKNRIPNGILVSGQNCTTGLSACTHIQALEDLR